MVASCYLAQQFGPRLQLQYGQQTVELHGEVKLLSDLVVRSGTHLVLNGKAQLTYGLASPKYEWKAAEG